VLSWLIFQRHRAGTGDAMPEGVQGTITGRDVIIHSLTILRHFGPSCYLRCLRAVVSRRSCTFLEVAWLEDDHRHSPRSGHAA
jgi:hypothetical protein